MQLFFYMLNKIYYSGSPDYSRYLRRIDRLVEKRKEALQFVTAAVGLSLGINLLASVLYNYVPQRIFLPSTVGCLLVVIVIAYLSMWGNMNSRESAPVLFISERTMTAPPQLKRIFALVTGGGFGVTLEASEILIKETGPMTADREFERIEFLVVETLLWWVICGGFREGWYFPGLNSENLNVSWVEGGTSTTGSVKLDLGNAINIDQHPFVRLRNRQSAFLAPKGTKIVIKRDERRRISTLTLMNDFVTVRCHIEWQGKGFPDFVNRSVWVPRGKGQDQVVYSVVVEVLYSWRSKLPFSKKSIEHMRWAERIADYLFSELSFRSFEDDRDRYWHTREVETVEKLLGISRWD